MLETVALAARGRRVRALVALVGVCVVSLMAAAVAYAGPSQTVHFNSQQMFGTPTGPTTNVSNCPAPVINDYVDINATGNGVAHQNTNPAGDFWATTTFTGSGTVTFYPASSLTFDSQGNVTGIVGPSDMTVSGHLKDWFGISSNKQNQVATGTVTFIGTITAGAGAGSPIKFHNLTHAGWQVGSDPNGPPDFFFDKAHC